MRHSEIWDNFVKIAIEKNMIPLDADQKAKKKLEENPRWSSQTEKDISKLYNLKPETSKGMEYDKNISYYAHKGNVVVSDAYDKLNGLVENINERQNILLNIVNKPVNGQSTNHKWAEQDLILSLVRLGNILDNQNKDELRALSDSCLSQISIKKTAFAPLAAAILIGVPALIGTIYAQQHLPNFDNGFEQNHKTLISELDDFLNSNSNFGVGTDYTKNFKTIISDFKNKLEDFYNSYTSYKPIIDKFEAPKTPKELIQLAGQPAGQEAVAAYNSLFKAFAIMLPIINQIQTNFNSESYKSRQVVDKGFLSSLVDKTQFLHGKTGLIADDFQDVINAIPPYKKSIKDILDVFKSAQDMQSTAKTELEQAATESSEYFGKDKSVKDVDNEAGDLNSQLKDLEKDLGPIL